jgi:hypothetical protein
MTSATEATPDRRAGTSISKHEGVEVGQWFRTPDSTYGPGITQEVVDLEWNQAAGGAIVYLRNYRDDRVYSAPFTSWRTGVRATLPPWAE